MSDMKVITGDCFEELEQLEAESVEACVTDPPYGLAFMGRSWDDFEPKEYQEWCEKWARIGLDVSDPSVLRDDQNQSGLESFDPKG